MGLTYNDIKGAKLTPAEADANIRHFELNPQGIMIPKTAGVGVLIDVDDPNFGWHDILGNIHIDEADANAPQYALWAGTRTKVRQFLPTTTEGLVEFHLPHDYAPGTPVYIHVHWSHNSSLVTGGTVTWGFELTYAKGHDQAAFSNTPALIAIISPASLSSRQHMIPETIASSTGGSATTIDTDALEPDGIIQGAIYLDSNDITVSSGGIPDPFVHYSDIHYQSTGVATKQKVPNFYV